MSKPEKLCVATINVNYKNHGKYAEELIEALNGKEPPRIIALQEVTEDALERYEKALIKKGFDPTCLITTLYDETPGGRLPIKNLGRMGQVIASRWPIIKLPRMRRPSLPDWPEELQLKIKNIFWPERLLSAEIHSTPWGDIEIHSAHVPNASSRMPPNPTREEEKLAWAKIYHMEAIYQYLTQDMPKHLRILCGDFNMPRAELPDGRAVTWAEEIHPNQYGERDVRWAARIRQAGGLQRGYDPSVWRASELKILQELGSDQTPAAYRMRDIYRERHGYSSLEHKEADAFSHYTGSARVLKNAKRYDHIFASLALAPLECDYVMEILTENLSDHAALKAVFTLASWSK